MQIAQKPDCKSSSQRLNIWDREFMGWEWNSPDKEEVVEAEVELPEESERPIPRG